MTAVVKDHVERIKGYVCPICSARFSVKEDRRGLSTVDMVHIDYRCTTCDATWTIRYVFESVLELLRVDKA